MIILFVVLFGLVVNPTTIVNCQDFKIEEATIEDIQQAFKENKLTSRQLVGFYLQRIETLNPILRGVIEVNPEAQDQADKADEERRRCKNMGVNGGVSLHGIPVLLKDSIATKDKLNTTAGSYALLGSEVPRDAGVVQRLRKAGAIILGKASMSEWYQFRSSDIPDGWCARSGQGMNPYVHGGNPCGSSSGSAISVAANMVAVSLGTETDGSIICPADYNSVVGLKPTVGLTSRAGVIPLSPRQDTIGPICRTVSDAVYVLDSIVGFDPEDSEATKEAAKFIPHGGYKSFLKQDGLKGKRLGVVRNPFLALSNRSSVIPVLEEHLRTIRQNGATVIDNLEIPNIDIVLNPIQSGEIVAFLAEFKVSLNDYYLKELVTSPVRSLSDIIVFNQNNPDLESGENFYGQEILIAANTTNGIREKERKAMETMETLSRDGFEKLMLENELDAMVTLGSTVSTVFAIGGYPAITVPAGYDLDGMPFGICFGGLKGEEPKLIEIAYAFEQVTKNPYAPSGTPCGSSSGSAISVAANMTAVSLGTETHSSIICPADHNSVVGLKLTVGLTSRAGVIPMAPRWDSVGPICRTVSDAVFVLDVVAGLDPRDEATREAAKFIPDGGYKQFLNANGLRGKRLGIVRHPFVEKMHGTVEIASFEGHINTLRQKGAIVLDNLEILHVDEILDPNHSGEISVMMADFKTSINAYLKELINSPVKSLADIITFNENNSQLEKLMKHDQNTFIAAEETNGFGEQEKEIVEKLDNLSQNGFEKLMEEHELDAMVTPGSRACPVYAIGGYPAITVPAGYETDGMPFGICFGGLKGTEPKLIEIAYAFEQATKVRRPPSSFGF